MRVLYSSFDLREQTELVKQLLGRGIPCGLLKNSDSSQLSVWIQHDSNFPLAVNVLADQNRARPLPPWACVFEKCLAEKPSVDKFANMPQEEENQLTLDYANNC